MRRRLLLGLTLFVCWTFPLRGQNFVCALSDKQEQDAPKAFDKLASLFTHPRCFNCHGGIVPFSGNKRGTHPDVQSTGIVKGADGGEDFVKTFEECHDCHDGFPSPVSPVQTWRLAPFAPRQTQFNQSGTAAPKSNLELCEQMKTMGRVPGAAGFIGHMKDDNGDADSPFLKTAFAGTLGWDPNDPSNKSNIDLAIAAFGSYPAPKPTVSQSEALQQSKDWVAAMGGRFRLPQDCGCKEKHYALRIIAKGILQMPGFTFHIGFAGQGTAFPEIPLKFKDDGSFSDSAIATPETDNEGSLPMIRCQGKRGNQIRVELKGSWKDITPNSTSPTDDPPSPPKTPITFSITLGQDATAASETCATPFGVMSGSSTRTGPPIFTFNFVFPDPQVNKDVTVDWPAPFPGWSGTVKAQLIEMP